MTDNEFMLFDRLQKIKSTVEKYGEDNFYISYSGGKDSNVLSELFDMALPDNKIPRVYCDTGIELNAVRDFVREKAAHDSRFVIIQPKVPIRKMLETVGYPFKSKEHSIQVERYQTNKHNRYVQIYLGKALTLKGQKAYQLCPQILKYQFTSENNLKISAKCCDELKKKPMKQWAKENKKSIKVLGIRKAERGLRTRSNCVVFGGGKLKTFQPLVPISDEFENWICEKYDIKLPVVYYPPFNFTRTGCKGCGYNLKLQEELDVLKQYFPSEYKQCEIIWKPVYDEYRRLGYRLKKRDENQLTFDDIT